MSTSDAPICCGFPMVWAGTEGSTKTGSFDKWRCSGTCRNTTTTPRS